MIGKITEIKQNELDCRDTAPLSSIAHKEDCSLQY